MRYWRPGHGGSAGGGMMDDVRWRQRFENFEKAYGHFTKALEGGWIKYSDLEKLGVIQLFELTLELAWKTSKDYLEYSGIEISAPSPQNVMREALAANLIKDADIWIEMIKQRNAFSHAYTAEDFENAFVKFQRYMDPLSSLRQLFKEQS